MFIKKITRWHIVRVYKDMLTKNKPISPFIEVSIHPINISEIEKKKLIENITNSNIIDGFSENTSWWDMDDEKSLSGTISEKTLLKLLVPRNTLAFDNVPKIKKGQSPASHDERQIEEDMVFLQFIYDNNKFEKVFSKLKKRNGIFNIDKILNNTDSVLIDFTSEARLMSSKMYENVLKNA